MKLFIKRFAVFFVVFILLIIGSMNIVKHSKNIDVILEGKAYSYLPVEAKDYIKQVYEKTGNLVLTEKNKEENNPYLNPRYVDYLTGKETSEYGEIPVSTIVDYSTKDYAELDNIPTSYNLSNVNGKNYVTPVRDQGDLGICWAFATSGSFESRLLKTNNISYSTSSRLISERQFDYAMSRNGINDYKSEYVSFIDRSLGDGGNFYISTIAMANGVSLTDYNSFKSYDDTDLHKMELQDTINFNKSLYEVDSTINVPWSSLRSSTDNLTSSQQLTRTSYLNEIKKNIMEKGASYVSTYMNYSCNYIEPTTNNLLIDVYDCTATGGHALEIIGWDDNFEYTYCNDGYEHSSDLTDCNWKVSGKGVWILKNSWGDTFQNPYLAFDSLYTSIHFIDKFESADNKNWDNNYILGEETEGMKQQTYTLSDTKIKGNEKLKKIKYITQTTGATYNVKVYKEDGTYELFTKDTSSPGLVTIDVTKDINVNKNTSIVISSSGKFIDKTMVFTSNIDKSPYVDITKYDDMILSDKTLRLYSNTKNIASGTLLTYKLYNSDDVDVSDKLTVTNNTVAENNINTLVTISSTLDNDTYRVDILNNSNIVSTFNFEYAQIEGTGTIDNPYQITNPSQLSQIRNHLDAYYELNNDIDLSVDTSEGGKLSLASDACPQGFGWRAISGFSGSLDGKGYSIKGLHQNNYLTCNEDKNPLHEWANNNNGLFVSAYGNATIKNLVIDGFDMNCQGSNCGALVSNYVDNKGDSNDTTEYTATFKNIVMKNCKIKGVYNSNNSNSSLINTYGGGLLGLLTSDNGSINISNIYLDINPVESSISNKAALFNLIYGKNVTIQNIQLSGVINGKYDDGSGDSVLGYTLGSYDPTSLSNVLSTLQATNVKGSLIGTTWGDQLSINGINAFKVSDKDLCALNGGTSSCLNATNVNLYDLDTQLVEFTKPSNYTSWLNFNDNWVIKTVDGIPRIPVLKFMNFEYTSIPDITINQQLNEYVSIYDYITPNTDAAKRITYKSNNEDIVKIDDNGKIIPQSTGTTTIHIESFYDGYIKDVPITITYVPHYNVVYDANLGTGTMDSVEVATGSNYTLKENIFTREYYNFIGWNTKADGTGDSYSDLGIISSTKDKEVITLYAQWLGEERELTLNADGGLVTPNKKTVNYGGTYGDLPVPIKDGYGFQGWSVDNPKIFKLVDPFTKITDYSLIAYWVNNAYTIVYNSNYGKLKSDYVSTSSYRIASDDVVTTYATNSTDFTLSNSMYERQGYIFNGWNTKIDGTGTTYIANEIINLNNVNNSTLQLYANWVPITKTITFNSNGGTGTMNSIDVDYNSNKVLPANTFNKTGYTFNGWNTKIDGTGTTLNDGQTIRITDNITLYAQWEINQYIVTMHANNGTTDSSNQTLNYNESTKLYANTFVKDGYVFKQWNTLADGTGTNYADEQLITITDNLDLYAIWEEDYKYIINTYSYDDTINIIDGILVNTTIDNFKKNFVLQNGYTLSVETAYSVMNTGSLTKILHNGVLYKEYTNIVRGDVNGDGKVSSLDYIKIKKHIMTTEVISNTVTFNAADVNGDYKITSGDYVRIRKYIMNGGSL